MNDLKVREITNKDIPLISDYWVEADPAFLISMGVDLSKVPNREELEKMLTSQVETPINLKKSFALIWEINGVPVGHCNVNSIIFGNKAKMHLHLWKNDFRNKGDGLKLVRKSIPLFFDRLNLNLIECEPYAKNPAPNRTLEKAGFTFIKTYNTIPGSLNFKQDVNLWQLKKQDYESTF